MTISQKLWQNNQDLVQICLNHPFIQGIVKGNLEQQKFTFYVGQDAFFLEAFARAYSIAAAKSPDWQGFESFHRLAEGVLQELNLHHSYAAKWGVKIKEIKPSVATSRYTDFLLATAWGKDVGTTAVAMSPCMRLYAFLGQQLVKDGIPEHQYADWLITYSSQEFEELAQQLEHLADRYAVNTDEIQFTYRYALLCERDFFDAAWIAIANIVSK